MIPLPMLRPPEMILSRRCVPGTFLNCVHCAQLHYTVRDHTRAARTHTRKNPKPDQVVIMFFWFLDISFPISFFILIWKSVRFQCLCHRVVVFFFIHLLSRMHKIRLDDFVSLFDLKTENRKNNMKKRIFVTRRRKSKRKSSTK